MRSFIMLIFFQVIFLNTYQSWAFSTSVKDVETEFIVLEFPKYEKYKIQEMLTELHSYQGKITDAQFDFTTQRLTVSYSALISLDDILQIVSNYKMDYTKISGSEFE
jgi:hypothetical protein